MQISLKQPEIIKALEHYVAILGVSLRNRRVDIQFTAGRGPSGLSAEIEITDDINMPDFGDAENHQEKDVVVKPAMCLVSSIVTPTAGEVVEPGENSPSRTTSLFN